MTARERRALLAGGAVILVAVLALRVAPALAREYAALRARAAERTALLVRARAALETADAVRDSLAVVAREVVALAPKLVAGETVAAAAATLTSELSGLAERSGLRIVTLNAMADSAVGTFRPVVLRGQFEGDVRGLAGLLGAVERHPKVLTVRELRVLATDPTERRPGPELLRIELTVAGWRVERPAS